jgi:hypothetical protein
MKADCSCSTDVEQETNGLYSFNRKEKLSVEKVKAVVDETLKIFYRNHPCEE